MPKGVYLRTEWHKEKMRVPHPNMLHRRIRTLHGNRWKNGEKNSGGYILVSKDGKYTQRSHLVMEQAIGRPLEEGEVVHHKNGVKGDDRIENLQLFSDTAGHTRLHLAQGDIPPPKVRGRPFAKGHPYYPKRYKPRIVRTREVLERRVNGDGR